MPDTRLSALTELAATPASTDEVYIRDVSEAAADESKRITLANLLALYDAVAATLTNKTFDANGTGNSLSNVDLTADVINDLPVAEGGTGASDAATALTNLGGIGAATTDTLTNKTLDANGTGNSIINIENEDIAAAAAIVGSKLVASTATARGAVELAIVAETDTGTDATRAVTPDALAGSNFGEKTVEMVVFDFGTDVATGDGKFYFHVPSPLDGMNLVEVHAEVITAGTTNTTDIQIANATDSVDMLSTVLTIDSGETGSDSAATPALIDGTTDDVATNDLLRIDVDAVSTTAPKGLLITLTFRLP